MTPKEILIAARDLIAEPQHWTQHSLAKNANGDWAYYMGDEAVCWCAIGAIGKVADNDASYQEQNEAVDLLASVMGVKWVNDFNDTHNHSQVIAAFDAAIKEAP